MHIPIREFQLSPKKWLPLLTDEGAELESGDGEVLAHIRPTSERSLILTRLNEIEALLSESKPITSKEPFEELKAKFDVRAVTPETNLYPTCDKCTRPSKDLKPHFEEGQEYRVCPSCLKPKKK